MEIFVKKEAYVYFVLDLDRSNEDSYVIRIGESIKPKNRYYQIKSHTASQVKMIITIKSSYAKVLEKLLQNHFKYKVISKSYFRLSKYDLIAILQKRLPYPLGDLMGEVVIYHKGES